MQKFRYILIFMILISGFLFLIPAKSAHSYFIEQIEPDKQEVPDYETEHLVWSDILPKAEAVEFFNLNFFMKLAALSWILLTAGILFVLFKMRINSTLELASLSLSKSTLSFLFSGIADLLLILGIAIAFPVVIYISSINSVIITETSMLKTGFFVFAISFIAGRLILWAGYESISKPVNILSILVIIAGYILFSSSIYKIYL